MHHSPFSALRARLDEEFHPGGTFFRPEVLRFGEKRLHAGGDCVSLALPAKPLKILKIRGYGLLKNAL